MITINTNPSRRTVRQFTLIWLAFFALAGAWLWRKDGNLQWAAVVWSIGLPIGAIGGIMPSFMRWVYVAVSYMTFPIGWVVSRVVLATVFYLTVTPIGLVMRLWGRDAMRRRFEPEAETYWVPRRQQGDKGRYFRQF